MHIIGGKHVVIDLKLYRQKHNSFKDNTKANNIVNATID